MIRIIYFSVIFLIISLVGCAPRGVRHVVQPGQTLYRISKTYHVPVERLISSNRIKDASKIKVGQALWIPGVSNTRTVSVVPKPAIKKKTSTVTSRKKIRPAKTTPVAASIKRSLPPVSPKKGQLLWPLKGKVVTAFNLKSRTPSKGIDISAKVGSRINSAAAGKVIYSGNGISGYGHVVIIEHDHYLFTVYGYNKKNLVASGAYINSGQQIALVGVPPGHNQGRLHFEVWREKKAINPALYLP
jgi:lipoprotein NlpD